MSRPDGSDSPVPLPSWQRAGTTIPASALIYSMLGLVIFAGFTMFDFQRIRLSRDISSAPLPAASIFLDILNVFLFFLQILSRQE